jgi:hypothetical protein
MIFLFSFLENQKTSDSMGMLHETFQNDTGIVSLDLMHYFLC